VFDGVMNIKTVHAHTFQKTVATTGKFPEPFQPADISNGMLCADCRCRVATEKNKL
jgi:hypothetical protein